jgi:LysM repeat protein
MATRCLGLLLALAACTAAYAATIKEEFGVCPRYTVKQGDILFDIAKKLGVEQEKIITASNACGVNTTNLQIGQELCLPGYIVARCQYVLRTDPDRPYCQVYTFQLGDTLKAVADKFDTTEAELTKLNSDYLAGGSQLPKAGQYIRLPGWNQKECRDFNDNDRPTCQVYTVQSGDTITTISQRYKVDAAETLALNNLTADSTLPLNFRLKLPKWNESCPAEGVPAVLPSDTVQCRVAQLRMNENLSVLAERVSL